MSTKRKPTVLASQVDGHSATLQLRVDHDLLDFSGHFTHFPLLPGVTQIDWAMFYGQTLLQCPAAFKGMEVIKFQEPILPDAQVTLSLVWDESKAKLQFSYTSSRDGKRVSHSSGKMKLGASSD
ncbi:TPA: 3-hydroxyacyl-ACP dehydratase [Vibrio vulnificus]|nr:3-hydroxyacyl-ACP dehydratase [Vibrio vulnificus]HAT8538745.1 3-hydroxyacyl-ACP dehydratase [Vibrio vulnificus]HDY7450389.1 3-hydroxyacyl-ACP dehydratase [Vibrio vulnificus]HDY7638810.1 3-hydroxyacyl-ACP dehydratase [Vibrio vulnificus]HDY7680042.1 3-hydroxyacyl-ACP dehydratase [Vibrio vulnificus]